MPYVMRAACSRSPSAGMPLEPIQFGVVQVPEASMIARAVISLSPASVRMRSTNGARSRPGVFTLSKPRRVIDSTRAPN